MGTKTVRLDEETENKLAQIQAMTGLSASDALRKGLNTLHRERLENASANPWNVYQSLPLGKSSCTQRRARDAKKNIRTVVQDKHTS